MPRVYVRSSGSIDRSNKINRGHSRRARGAALALCGAAVCALWATVPDRAALVDFRSRRDGYTWFTPRLNWFRSLGVAAVASVDVARADLLHVGIFGTWFAPAECLRAVRIALAEVDWATYIDGDVRLLMFALVAVYVVHRVCGPENLRDHCVAARRNLARPWSLVLAALSHDDAFHLLTNLSSIEAVAPRALATLGRAQFWTLVVAGCLSSSLASIVLNGLFVGQTDSRGASGVVCAMLAFEAARAPDSEHHLLFGLRLKAPIALALHLALDLLLRRSSIDVFAHFGGATCGAAYFKWWEQRRVLAPWWHDFLWPSARTAAGCARSSSQNSYTAFW